jgi:hypothetical protein
LTDSTNENNSPPSSLTGSPTNTIDDDFMAEVRDHFSDIEIIELAALCAMTLGNGRFMTVLGVAADDDGYYLLPEGSS